MNQFRLKVISCNKDEKLFRPFATLFQEYNASTTKESNSRAEKNEITEYASGDQAKSM
jgi:hypothetical protein